jgi:catechol-2,3-dioxygenase
MPIHRLNHAVLYVRDVPVSVSFYTDVLKFTVVGSMADRAAFLRAPDSANDHDLALFAIGADAADSMAGRGAVGLYHLAWEVSTLGDLETVRNDLLAAGALVGSSDHGTTKSLYGKDPDGLEFEIVWLIPAHLLTDDITVGVAKLDLDKEIAQYGRDTRSGLGISVPLGITVV